MIKKRAKIIRVKSIRDLLLIFFAAAAFLLFASQESENLALPSSEAPVELYSNHSSVPLQQMILKAIGSSKKSILLIIYSLNDPAVIRLLNEKADAGVDVSVICDAAASQHAGRKLKKKIKLKTRFGKGLMHQKLLVIDERQVWIGSANMTTASLCLHDNLILAMDHPALAREILNKAEMMDEEGTHYRRPPLRSSAGGQSFEFWFLPSNPEAIEKIKSLMRSAKKTMRIAMFTWTRMDLANEAIAAAKRGVDVKIMIDRQQGKGAGSKIVKLLKKKGVKVKLSPQGFALLHHKFAYIDSELLICGSANWTKAAFTQNDDCFIILDQVNDKQKHALDKLWDLIFQAS